MQKALKEAGQILVDATKSTLRNKLSAGATTRPNRWNGKTMEEGIRLTNDKAYQQVIVSILGDFRLWIFENGTTKRETSSGSNRGSISARNFFADAVSSSQSAIESTIISSVENSLNSLN